MTNDTVWQIFAETGDPMCWLMYRASEKRNKKKAPAEDSPSPEN